MLLGGHALHDLCDRRGHSIGESEWRILWQINIDIGEMREILRKELKLEIRSYPEAEHKHDERNQKAEPPMLDGELPQTIVGGAKSALAPFLNARLRPGPQQVVAEEGNERHRDKTRRDQRTANHDRQ